MEWLNTDDSLLYSSNNSDIIVPMELQFAYTFLEVIVAVVAVIGNGMVILVFRQEKRLRRRTNYYIVSLAVADLLVGLLGIPFAILASVGLPTNLHACLFTVSLLVVLCTISIFCLVAVSVDRYWAILHPMGYSRNVRTKTTIVIISLCWVAGACVGFLPLFGWHANPSENVSCFFVKVMDYNYLVFLYFATIITPSLIMAAFYAHIYRVVVKQLKQIVTMNPEGGSSKKRFSRKTPSGKKRKPCESAGGGGTMLRVLGAAQKREVKATQNLSIIVLFFMICWIPLYTINCIKAFCPGCHIAATWTDFCIILSHLNSAVNPILYAYHLRDFRAALKSLIYKIFSLKETPLNDNYYKPSIVSYTNRNMEKRYNSQHAKIYIDSPVWLRQQQESDAAGSNNSSAFTPTAESPPLVLQTVVEPSLQQKREIWMISEVPSISERDVCGVDGVAIISRDDDLQYYSEDDDVFVPSIENSVTVTQYDFITPNLQHSADEILLKKLKSPISNFESSSILSGDDVIQNRTLDDTGQQSRPNDNFSIYCIDNNNIHKQLKRSNKLQNVSNDSSNESTQYEIEEHNQMPECDCSPTKRLSPLKIVSDFLINQSANKLVRRNNYKETSERISGRGSSDVFQYLDLHNQSNNRNDDKCSLDNR